MKCESNGSHSLNKNGTNEFCLQAEAKQTYFEYFYFLRLNIYLKLLKN